MDRTGFRSAPGRERQREGIFLLNDEQIIALFFQRAEEGITRLREAYGRLSLAAARRIVPDERDAEECVADACLRVWNTIPPQRPQSLRAYFLRITRNLALDRLDYNRAQQRSSALTSAFEELEACLPAARSSTVEAAEAAQLRFFLNDFLRAQPKAARVCFLRRYWYGESIREIADESHLRENTVKTMLFRTRAKLREALEKEGISV